MSRKNMFFGFVLRNYFLSEIKKFIQMRLAQSLGPEIKFWNKYFTQRENYINQRLLYGLTHSHRLYDFKNLLKSTQTLPIIQFYFEFWERIERKTMVSLNGLEIKIFWWDNLLKMIPINQFQTVLSRQRWQIY